MLFYEIILYMEFLVIFMQDNAYLQEILPLQIKLTINKFIVFINTVINLKKKYDKYIIYLGEDTYNKIIIFIKLCIIHRLFCYTLTIIQLKELYEKEPNITILYIL